MIPNRQHTQTMPDLYFLPSYSYVLSPLLVFFLFPRSTMFLDAGSELLSIIHCHEGTELRDMERTLNAVHRHPWDTAPVSINFEHSLKTFPGWVWSYVIISITLYLQTKVTMIYTYTIGIVNYFQLLCQLYSFYCGNL